jgi:hypothetical protein
MTARPVKKPGERSRVASISPSQKSSGARGARTNAMNERPRKRTGEGRVREDAAIGFDMALISPRHG